MYLRTPSPAAWMLLTTATFAYASTSQAAEIYTEKAPPPLRTERMPQPHEGLVWAPGYWEWSGKAFYWIEGTWLVERRKQRWVSAQWEQAGGKWHFLPGHWDHQG